MLPVRGTPRETRHVNRAGILIIGISAVTGACFAALAGLSISALAFPVRRPHVFSAIVAAVAICIGYLAFRAAIAGETDEETAVAGMRRGVIGALVGLIVMIAIFVMFKTDAQAYLAHALGKRASTFTTYRLLAGSVLLGFGTGFVLGLPKAR